MRIIVNCPDSTKIISVVATGRKGSSIWANQNLLSTEDNNEITIQEPEEECEEVSITNDYTTPFEPVKSIKLVKAGIITLERQENEIDRP